jgi:hypothetical protein
VLGGSVGDVSDYFLLKSEVHAAVKKCMDSLAFSKPSPLVLHAIIAACSQGCPEAIISLLGPDDALRAVPLHGTDAFPDVFQAVVLGNVPRVTVGILTQALVTAFTKHERQDLLQTAAYPAIHNNDEALFHWLLESTLRFWSNDELSVPVLTAVQEGWLHPLQEILAIEGPPWQEHQLQEVMEAAARSGFFPAAELLLAAVPGWSKGGLTAAMSLTRSADLVQLLLESAEDDWEAWELLEVLNSAMSCKRVEVVERILAAVHDRWQPEELAEAAARALVYEGEQDHSLLKMLLGAAGGLWNPEHLCEELAKAACYGNLEAVKSILAAVPCWEWGHQQLSKALMQSVQHKQLLVLKELLLANSAYKSPWGAECLAKAVVEACNVDQLDILQQLLDASPQQWKPSQLAGAVVEAVWQGSDAALVKLLEPCHISNSGIQ